MRDRQAVERMAISESQLQAVNENEDKSKQTTCGRQLARLKHGGRHFRLSGAD
jgi:hypothetical protein